MASDWPVAEAVAPTGFAKIAADDVTEVTPDMPHLDTSDLPGEHELDSSPFEEDALLKMVRCREEQHSETSHDTTNMRASLGGNLTWDQCTFEDFDKACKRLDDKFVEKVERYSAVADVYADKCVDTLASLTAGADRRVDNLKLLERYDSFDEKFGRKVSETVDVLSQKVSMGVTNVVAQIRSMRTGGA